MPHWGARVTVLKVTVPASTANIGPGFDALGMALGLHDLDAAARQLAAEFEGHADNAAASLFGGLVIAWGEGGNFRAARLVPHPSLRPVAAVPAVRSSTEATRGLLPGSVPHADAAYN